MKKRYSVQPPLEIELEFPEKILTLRFDAAALFHANDLEDGLYGLLKNSSPTELCAAIIYMGACEQEPGFSQEDARAVVAMLDIGTVTGIIEDFTESLDLGTNEALNEMQKKTILELLEKMQK